MKFGQFHLSSSDAVCGGFFDGSVVTPSEAASCVLRTPIPATFSAHTFFWALRFPSSDTSPNRSAWFVSRRCVAQLRSAGRVDCHLHLKATLQVVVGQVWCAVL